MNQITRRSFLKTTLAAAGATLPARSWSQVPGANSDVRVAVVGLGSRGFGNHIPGYLGLKGVRIAAICDPDTARLERATRLLREKGTNAQTFVDVREVLARSDIDAVSIATCNHWHSTITIWACQAGKDVYVEKPISHTIWEGRQAVRAAAKYNRVVQAGTQNRSRQSIAEAVAWVRAGHLGRITAVRGMCYKRRPSIGLTTGPQPVPTTVNYDLWLGPAPMTPLRRKRLHGDWHWFWATGNGDIGNQGVHQMDIMRWFVGGPGLPTNSLAVGGRFGYIDDAETANTHLIVQDHPVAPFIFEVRGLPTRSGNEVMDRYPDRTIGTSVGIVVHCEGGMVMVPNLGTRPHSPDATPKAYDKSGKLVRVFQDQTIQWVEHRHFGNFVDVVRSRRTADLRVPILEGHYAAALCHLGNISYRLGRRLPPDELREKIKGSPHMSEAFGRMSEHLAVNGIDLGRDPAALGMPLSIDAERERCHGDDAANALLRDSYRAPYTFAEIA